MSEIDNKEKGHFRKNWPFYALLLIAIGLSGFLWISKDMALKKQTETFDSDKRIMVGQYNEALRDNSKKEVELMMKTFVWAIRSEMIRDNQEQVNLYFGQLVKTENVDEITMVDKSGKILISTNKKNEGVILTTDYAADVLNIEEVSIFDKPEHLVVAAPVLSIDSKIGTLIVLYKSDAFQLDATKGMKN